MSTPNETHPYNYPTSSANDFERLGHPGKWKKTISVSGTTWFTGSNYGVGAILPSGTGSPAGTAYLTDGGSIDISKLSKGVIYELSVAYITGGSDVYALFRNQVIR
jgi:hypothetical protein